MKKNIQNILLIITILILCTFIVLFSINYLNTDKSIIKSGKEQKQSSKTLALMYETFPETGEYQVSTDSAWPSTAYTFNSTLSKCENGSTLTYDTASKKVKVQSTKSDKCFVYFDKEYIEPIINSITESNVTKTEITIIANVTAGTNPIKMYHYSKDNGGSYVTSSSNSYTFNGLSEGTAYNIKVKVEDTGSRYSEISSKTVTTKRTTIADVCVGQNLAQCMKTNYQKDGMDYHTSTLANGANDGSYRFSGANPINYVCFGPGATAAGITCPDNNLYRIIGVFGNQVKIIKKTSIGNKQWDNKGTYGENTWSTSLINSYLNGEYLNSLTPNWSNKIASNTWQVGGMKIAISSEEPSIVYNNEVGISKANVTFNGKIGLMYVSDYGFAAQPQAWILKLGGYHDNVQDYSNPIAKENNWLFAGNNEWTISPISDLSNFIKRITNNFGNIDLERPNESIAVRPVFYLQSSTNLNGGNGTAIDPYRV